MAFVLGVVLFALLIGISIALHELGHLATAKAFGMKVTRYYIGFGPRVWSMRRGETEYGLKAIPAGGFCEIVGMTALDELSPEDEKRAFYRQKTWKRVVVLSAGSITHFIVGFVVLYAMAATIGLPDIRDEAVVSKVSQCVPATAAEAKKENPTCAPTDPTPGVSAGVQQGDRIVAVDGQRLPTWTEVQKKIQQSSGPTEVVVLRGDDEVKLTVDIPQVERELRRADGSTYVDTVGVVGVAKSRLYEYNALTAVGGATKYTGDMFANTWRGLMKFPEKIPMVIKAIGGGERDPEAPVSVVGASILGGDAVSAGLWHFFWLMLAGLNFFIGVFNLLPLLPLDGGHIAVNLYERVRDWVRKLRGKPAGPPVNYLRLLPLTYFAIFVGGAITLLTITADIVNPIRLP
ncbi:site-2 protease family protein [Actinosynnema pretiosum subsp. pretiosum]|uniref:Peptidase M50 n=2 Tax=Actinosynnema TaxID=40566 RepID=C6WES3_ACTMD|nr:site-2 protease family protein [Actinosynnema mirum]ACU39698.1 peptidase M50 [Actinosynnema mirum DSM 43827]AXX33210.1 Intramembrane protease RasP/YluC, implicated in cell division based on FtsL cleavage [Actinosynnema pretiosum subsp. pretiosum]QUF02959.1 site-2 protease family protein [Actinosynnema pretiosum subsp. pretiosum]